MQGFDNYLDQTMRSCSLFDESPTRSFQNSKDSPLIQLADFVAGTLAYAYSPDKDCGEYKQLFKERLLAKQIQFLPYPELDSNSFGFHRRDSGADKEIRNANLQSCFKFINKHEHDVSGNRRKQILVLRLLLLIADESDAEESAHNQTIADYLERNGFDRPGPQNVRQDIIGPLRDENIIVTGDNKGYRLTLSNDDVRAYIRHSKGIIQPMLKRINTARFLLRNGTPSSFDILGEDQDRMIRDIADAYHESQIDAHCEAPDSDHEHI